MQFVSPSIVTNGLVLCYDAANVKSYPGSGTNLVDLIQTGKNGTLVNGVGFSNANSGQLTFDGINDIVTTTFNDSLGDFTVGVWFKATDSSNGSTARIVDKTYATGFWLGKIDTVVPHMWGGGVKETSPPFGRYITLTDGAWHYLISVRSGTTHTIYGDGITNTVSGTVPSSATDTSNLSLATDNNDTPSVRFKGNVAMVQIYNRALTTTEILQNFNATRGRFGI